MYAVCVTFKLKPGQMAAFMPLMHANAQTSLADEPGCKQFDVLTCPDTPNTVFLYELYDNRAAFDAHLISPHFTVFDATASDMIADKSVQFWSEVAQ